MYKPVRGHKEDLSACQAFLGQRSNVLKESVILTYLFTSTRPCILSNRPPK